MKLKKKTLKIVSLALSFCFVFLGMSYLIAVLPRLKNNSNYNLLVSSMAMSYSTFSTKYNVDDYNVYSNAGTGITLNGNVNSDVVLSYNTQWGEDSDSLTAVECFERISDNGGIDDYIKVGDKVYGKYIYDEKILTQNNLNGNDVYYDYDNNHISFMDVNDEQYEYEYTNNNLTSIKLNDENYASFTYDNSGRITQEKYYTLGVIYDHTNVATIQKAYDPQTESTVVAKIYDYINDEPYQLTYSNIIDNGRQYNVVTKVEYEGKEINFEYNYFYNNKAYITKVTTEDESYCFSYINDKVIAKVSTDVKTTFIYSQTGDILGMLVGTESDDGYYDIFVTFVKDGFGNVIEANYLTINDSDELVLEKVYEQQFNSFGNKIFQNEYKTHAVTNFGYMGGICFNDFNLTYIDGNLYSPLMCDFILDQGGNLDLRRFVGTAEERIDPTLNSVEKSIAVESLQKEISLQLSTSSISGLQMIADGEYSGVIDIFTLPVQVDPTNILKYPSKTFFVVDMDNTAEVNYYKNFASTNFTTDKQVYAVYDDYYLTSLADKDISLQFIYNNTLYTITYVQEGIYGYTRTTGYSSSNYLASKNIMNYDTGRYVTYYTSTLDTDSYVSGASFITNFSTSDLNTFFEELGMINTSIGQTYQNVNFGDNAEYIKNLLNNTCNLHLPEYDPDTQYLTVDDNGNYIVMDIPADAGVEETQFVPDFRAIKAGALKVLQAAMFIASGALILSSCGTFAIVCGWITIGGGSIVGLCGVIQIVHGATGESWIVNNVLNGNTEILETIASVASVVATVASILGSITYKSCFIAGTQVQTVNGLVNIENIKVGDYVLSYNQETGENQYSKVIDIYQNTTDKLCQIEYGDTKLTSTLTHPYFVEGKWKQAKDVQVGNKLLLTNGEYITVKNINIFDCEQINVYNLNVDETHTYYAEDVLVHNVCGDALEDYINDTVYKTKEFQDATATIQAKYPAQMPKKQWGAVRKDIWKEFGQNVLKNRNTVLQDKISNFTEVLKGKAPIINGQRIQLHHVISKANNMTWVVPMTPAQHTAFHRMFGYYYSNPKLPWPLPKTTPF
ncbi:MAG: hypothetical protein J6T74_08175 [Clostridia bacterium]|nr:hypothetical protein [Clostridia bacterium]